MQERVLTGGHGLMANGYYPVIESLARGLDIRLNQMFVFLMYLKMLGVYSCQTCFHGYYGW